MKNLLKTQIFIISIFISSFCSGQSFINYLDAAVGTPAKKDRFFFENGFDLIKQKQFNGLTSVYRNKKNDYFIDKGIQTATDFSHVEIANASDKIIKEMLAFTDTQKGFTGYENELLKRKGLRLVSIANSDYYYKYKGFLVSFSYKKYSERDTQTWEEKPYHPYYLNIYFMRP